jgi:hypothetical protein
MTDEDDTWLGYEGEANDGDGNELYQRSMPSRHPLPIASEWVVVLRCGADRHRHPPRVGEVHGGGDAVWWASRRGRGQRQGGGRGVPASPPPPSLRFPCGGRLEGGGRCRADWQVATDRLQAAYWRAALDGKRELVFQFDL